MFDVGLGEIIVLAVIALIVFGPDHLPNAASQAGSFIRQIRKMAADARKEISDSAGLDSLSDDLRSLQDLHPKRIIGSVLDGDQGDVSKPVTPPTSQTAGGEGAPAERFDPDAT